MMSHSEVLGVGLEHMNRGGQAQLTYNTLSLSSFGTSIYRPIYIVLQITDTLFLHSFFFFSFIPLSVSFRIVSIVLFSNMLTFSSSMSDYALFILEIPFGGHLAGSVG